MAAARTKTIKNKHSSKTSKSAPSKDAKRSAADGVSKSRKPKPTPASKQLKERRATDLHRRPKKKTYTAEQLGVPQLNTITPVGVIKPKGKKKGKVFVDDPVSFHVRCSDIHQENFPHGISW